MILQFREVTDDGPAKRYTPDNALAVAIQRVKGDLLSMEDLMLLKNADFKVVVFMMQPVPVEL